MKCAIVAGPRLVRKQTAVLLAVTILCLINLTSVMGEPARHGAIAGKVTDSETGAPIVGASITVIGTQKGAFSNPEGDFTCRIVPAGIYTLKMTALEYNSVILEGVEVRNGETTTVTIVATKKKVEHLEGSIRLNASESAASKMEVSSRAMRPQTSASKELQKTDRTTVPEVTLRDAESGSSYSSDPYCGTPPYGYETRFDDMYFRDYGVNGFVDATADNLSTFAADVDNASFSLARAYLDRGELPPHAAIRAEEFINNFDYNYAIPKDKTFGVYSELANSPFREDNVWLLSVGIKARDLKRQVRKPANLVFVIDVSGSMAREDRLGLVKDALHVLVRSMTPRDKIGIVTYNHSARELLESATVRHRGMIENAINRLHANGSTNAEAGIILGYRMAARHYTPGATNRIILLSDGVANVGNTTAEVILSQVQQHIARGITLTSIGVGMGNYNDVILEQLANQANGNYAYVNDLAEANRIFADNLAGTLQLVARDLKIQVEFDKSVVSTYRLLGYENRAVADRNFRNENVDGGEIGPGHEVTALYELTFKPNRRSSNIGRVGLRYKDPDSPDEVSELSVPIVKTQYRREIRQATDQMKLAFVSGKFADILRESPWSNPRQLPALYQLASELREVDEHGQLQHLLTMIRTADQLMNALAYRYED